MRLTNETYVEHPDTGEPVLVPAFKTIWEVIDELLHPRASAPVNVAESEPEA